MSIEELIRQLKTFPAGMQVVLPGYEGGYNDIDTITQFSIKLNVHKNWWDGAHEKAMQKMLLKLYY